MSSPSADDARKLCRTSLKETPLQLLGECYATIYEKAREGGTWVWCDARIGAAGEANL